MPIDLHTHSVHSDGTDTPEQLVQAAAAAGLRVVALTDHDASAGWGEAGRAGERAGVTVVPGLEISCSRRRTSIHLLAYLPDPAHPGLVAELEASRGARVSRMQVMTERLAAAGYPIGYADVLAQADSGATIGRPHLADALVAAGCYPDRSAAFDDVLHDSSPYYVGHYAPDPVTAVQLVVAAGGVPVLAHPFAGSRGRIVDGSVLEEMVGAGLAGLEAHHRDHGAMERARAEDLAAAHGLFVTGSSDYHGAGKPNVLGEHTTAPDVLEQILEAGSGTPLLGRPLSR